VVIVDGRVALLLALTGETNSERLERTFSA